MTMRPAPDTELDRAEQLDQLPLDTVVVAADGVPARLVRYAAIWLRGDEEVPSARLTTTGPATVLTYRLTDAEDT